MRARHRRSQRNEYPPIRRAAARSPAVIKPARQASGGEWVWLGTSALLCALSLGGVLRLNAMPAEARTQETWYAYTQELGYDFTARVKSGTIYPQELVGAGDLARSRLPVEPPAYRRVLVGPLAESIKVVLPYRFRADREALIRVTYRVDGEIGVPNLWRREYPLMAPQTMVARASEFQLEDLALEIPVGQFREEVARFSEELKLPSDLVEIRIRPVLHLEVEGQKEPVSPRMESEFVIVIRGGGHAIELDEPRVVKDAKQWESSLRLPLSVQIWGRQVPVPLLRRTSYGLFGLFAAILAAGVGNWWLRRKPEPADSLRRLGNGLIRAHQLSLPEGAVVVEVSSLEQMLSLHLQTERPLIKVGQRLYLIDGLACYAYGRSPSGSGIKRGRLAASVRRRTAGGGRQQP